jgi:structural maintenance of chromosomes protein 6
MILEIDNYNETVIIRSIELINFMCHDHLVINFTKPFTCIGGRNGSGKSAVMISLGILFGQRSSSLERGNSFKNLIKTGEQFFSIRCVLNNTKKFMYDFFGDYIIIEKKVTMKSSSFNISNKSKKNYSTKMEDLEYILDYFNIKLENPLNYLTQEQSKRFLSSSDPSHLYKLFMKGTEIADIKLINDKYESNIAKLKEKIANIEKSVEEINQDLDQESKRMEILANIDNLQDSIEKDKNELKWADVYLVKKEVENLEIEISNLEKEIAKCQIANSQILEESEELRRQKTNLIEFTQTLKNTNKEKMTQIEESLESKNRTIRSMENDLKELKESFDMKKNLMKRLEKSNTFVDDREKLHAKKKEIQKKLQEARMNHDEYENIVKVEKKKRDEQIAKNEEFKKKIWNLEKQIEFCKKTNENDVLHPELKNISQQIKNTNFNEQVIGPIANYVRLKDQKWWKTCSIILRNFLTTFICFNREDRDKLLKIFRNQNAAFTIFIPSSKSNDVINYEKNRDFVTLLDVLEVKNNVVLNQLILMAGIEQIALIEDRSLAYKAIRKNPYNIDSIYTVSGDKIKNLNGSISDFAPRKQDKYHFENPQSKLKNCQAELNKMLENKPQIKLSSDYERAVKTLDNVLMTINNLERKLDDIDREIENAEDVFSCQQEVLNNEEIFNSYKLLESQIRIINNKIVSCKKEILELNQEKDSISNTQYPSIYDIERKLQQIQIKFNVSNDNHLKIVQKKVTLNEKLVEKSTEFETKRINLLKEIPEITDPRPKDIIIDEMNKLNVEIEESKKIGNKQDTEEKIKDILERKKINEEILNLYKHKIEDVCESYMQRITKREEIKEFIAKNASRRFEELTSQRGYKGELSFSHDEEKLHLKMEVHNFGIAGSKETLSGGERSFAAMSLLFSLWPYISCPLKILDEFDVFMDDLNRKYIIQKFIEYFKKSENQVILITPLNTKDLVDDIVDIQILNPPRAL